MYASISILFMYICLMIILGEEHVSFIGHDSYYKVMRANKWHITHTQCMIMTSIILCYLNEVALFVR